MQPHAPARRRSVICDPGSAGVICMEQRKSTVALRAITVRREDSANYGYDLTLLTRAYLNPGSAGS